ncbi:MAG TPA: hypothetical protein VGA69_03980 [Nitriliruptorales bacterium]
MTGTDPRFDRVGRPATRARRSRDDGGKEALYSTSPEAPPDAHLLVRCERCGVQTGLRWFEVAKLVRPPFVVNPLRPSHVWTRCPACEERGWLHVSATGVVRAYLTRERGAER